MTTYVYETISTKPGEKPRYFEIKQSIKDAPLPKPPETGAAIRRVVLGGLEQGADACGGGFDHAALVIADGITELRERGIDGGEKFFGLQSGLGPDAFVHVLKGVLDALGDHLLHAFVIDIDGGVLDF